MRTKQHRAKCLLESLNPFDTILLRTHNSEYRILLLDPKTGRALVEGGEYLVEPSEALLKRFCSSRIRIQSWIDLRWISAGDVGRRKSLYHVADQISACETQQ